MRPSYLFSLVTSLALVGAGCLSPSPATPTDVIVPGTSTLPTAVLPVFPEDATPVRPRPAGTICDPGNFICVSESVVNRTIASPFTVTGSAIAFENTFQWSLRGPLNQSIASGTLMTTAPDIGQPGMFTLTSAITIPVGATTGTLRFFENSAENGTAIHILDIPVLF